MQKLGTTDEMEGDWRAKLCNHSISKRFLLTLLALVAFILILGLHNLSARSVFWQIWNAPDRGDSKVLRFGNDGKFRISIFEDLHFGEGTLTACS